MPIIRTMPKQRFYPLLMSTWTPILPVPLIEIGRPLHTSLPPHMWERTILQHQQMNVILPHISHRPHMYTSNKTRSSHRTKPTSYLKTSQRKQTNATTPLWILTTSMPQWMRNMNMTMSFLSSLFCSPIRSPMN